MPKFMIDKSTQTSGPSLVYPEASAPNPRNVRRLPPLVNSATEKAKRIENQGGQNEVNLIPRPGESLPLEKGKSSLVFPSIENRFKSRKPFGKSIPPRPKRLDLVQPPLNLQRKKRDFIIKKRSPVQNNPTLNVPGPGK